MFRTSRTGWEVVAWVEGHTTAPVVIGIKIGDLQVDHLETNVLSIFQIWVVAVLNKLAVAPGCL